MRQPGLDGTVTVQRRNVTARIIEDMTCGNSTLPRACGWCGGKGWKLLTLRRSAACRDTSERRVRRQRVRCLGCGGSGSVPRAGDRP